MFLVGKHRIGLSEANPMCTHKICFDAKIKDVFDTEQQTYMYYLSIIFLMLDCEATCNKEMTEIRRPFLTSVTIFTGFSVANAALYIEDSEKSENAQGKLSWFTRSIPLLQSGVLMQLLSCRTGLMVYLVRLVYWGRLDFAILEYAKYARTAS